MARKVSKTERDKRISRIKSEIKRLESKRNMESKRSANKYRKPIDNLLRRMDAECAKHPEKWREIQRRYLRKIDKINNEAYLKGTLAISRKYEPKIKKLVQEKAMLERIQY